MGVPAIDFERALQCEYLGPEVIATNLTAAFRKFDTQVHLYGVGHRSIETVVVATPGHEIRDIGRTAVLHIDGTRLDFLVPSQASTTYGPENFGADLVTRPGQLAKSLDQQVQAILVTGALRTLYEDLRDKDSKFEVITPK